MADILAFTLPPRPRNAAEAPSIRAADRRVIVLFRWVRDSATGRLICRWDAAPAEPDLCHFRKSA